MSLKNQAIVLADQRGYHCDESGRIYNPKGRELRLSRSGKYIGFSIYVDGKKVSITAHRFIAYQVFGGIIFQPGIQVRHLDDDKHNNQRDNLAYGTQSQNAMDRPKQDRVRIARYAARCRWQSAAA